MCVSSVNYFDGVCVTGAAVRSGGGSACSGRVALLGGARKFSSCGLPNGELKENKKQKKRLNCFSDSHKQRCM